jgi:hypothetical protein
MIPFLTQRILNEGPNILMSEYRWYTCLLNAKAQFIQQLYYEIFQHYGDQDLFNHEEMNYLIKIFENTKGF